MIKQLWINLPVKDINRTKAFYTEMGFTFNKNHPNTEGAVSLLVGEKEVVVMLFEEPIFKTFVGGDEISTREAGVLLSVDAQSKEEVDEMAKRAQEAGGNSGHKPSEMKGFMYGCLFTDPDGHRWNVLYMDRSKMPQP